MNSHWWYRIDEGMNGFVLGAQFALLLWGWIIPFLTGMDYAPWWVVWSPAMLVTLVISIAYMVVGVIMILDDPHTPLPGLLPEWDPPAAILPSSRTPA